MHRYDKIIITGGPEALECIADTPHEIKAAILVANPLANGRVFVEDEEILRKYAARAMHDYLRAECDLIREQLHPANSNAEEFRSELESTYGIPAEQAMLEFLVLNEVSDFIESQSKACGGNRNMARIIAHFKSKGIKQSIDNFFGDGNRAWDQYFSLLTETFLEAAASVNGVNSEGIIDYKDLMDLTEHAVNGLNHVGVSAERVARFGKESGFTRSSQKQVELVNIFTRYKDYNPGVIAAVILSGDKSISIDDVVVAAGIAHQNPIEKWAPDVIESAKATIRHYLKPDKAVKEKEILAKDIFAKEGVFTGTYRCTPFNIDLANHLLFEGPLSKEYKERMASRRFSAQVPIGIIKNSVSEDPRWVLSSLRQERDWRGTFSKLKGLCFTQFNTQTYDLGCIPFFSSLKDRMESQRLLEEFERRDGAFGRLQSNIMEDFRRGYLLGLSGVIDSSQSLPKKLANWLLPAST